MQHRMSSRRSTVNFSFSSRKNVPYNTTQIKLMNLSRLTCPDDTMTLTRLLMTIAIAIMLTTNVVLRNNKTTQCECVAKSDNRVSVCL